MKRKHVLNPSVVTTTLAGTTKQAIIEELLDLLMATGRVSDRALALDSLLSREKKMSTGLQFGVAIPHAKTPAVKELVACIGLKKEGVDFASLDGEPSRIFIMTLSPENRTGPHVQFLAQVSSILKSQAARDELLQSATSRSVLKLFGVDPS
jgi:mannitol/fructose-specific phosphotransferase system IIA component (Ntr-type)